MQEELADKIISSYIKKPTSYGLLISGKWGAGKTYFVENVLKPKVESTNTVRDNTKQYRFVRVSVFGFNNVEDIQSAFYSRLQFLLQKGEVFAEGLIQHFAKYALKSKGLGVFGGATENIKLPKKTKELKTSELVICIDDIERRSEKLSLKELIGFINSLVDYSAAKVIVLANQDKLDEKDYDELKEKVLGNIIEFIPDKKGTIKNIINTTFSASKKYSKLLLSQIKTIENTFSPNSSNFRVLYFAFSQFQDIYSQLELTFPKDLKNNLLRDRLYSSLLRFIIAISIEYRKGEISFKDKGNLQLAAKYDRFMKNLPKSEIDHDKENKTEYRKKFIESYYPQVDYMFYSSIYDFITSGSSLNLNLLISEIQTQRFLKDEDILPHYILLNHLSIDKVLILSDEEYKSKTEQLIDEISKGNYSLKDYMTIFDYLMRFGNPCDFDVTEIEQTIIKAIEETTSIKEYLPLGGLFFSNSQMEGHPYEKNIKKISNKCISTNIKLAKKVAVDTSKNYESMFYENISMFMNTILPEENGYNTKPIFNKFDADKFANFIVETSNKDKYDIARMLHTRFRVKHLEVIKEEEEFFKEVQKIISLNETETNISGQHLKDIKNVIKSILEWEDSISF